MYYTKYGDVFISSIQKSSIQKLFLVLKESFEFRLFKESIALQFF